MQVRAFDHERLIVYRKALEFVAVATEYVSAWLASWAVTDQFTRAADSMVVNLAQAASQRTPDSKSAGADCALGSALECAACLDIAGILDLLPEDEVMRAKTRLVEIVRMLVGLHKSWKKQVREDEPEWEVANTRRSSCTLFSHERLEAYQVALDLVRWFRRQCDDVAGPAGRLRQIDAAITSLVLNIAEGNGRFPVTDQRRFLGIAERAAVKAAAHLDIAVTRHDLSEVVAAEGKVLLVRAVSMLARMISPDVYQSDLT